MELSIPDFVMWWLSDPVHAVIAVVCVAAVFVVVGLVSASARRRRSSLPDGRGRAPAREAGAYGQRFDLPEQQRKGQPSRGARQARPSLGDAMTRILFICHGNICRSTMAQFVMEELVRRAGARTSS